MSHAERPNLAVGLSMAIQSKSRKSAVPS
jgi:hypothetical protein